MGAGLPRHGLIMTARFYADPIDPLELTTASYASLIASPFVDEAIAGQAGHPVVVVRGDDGDELPSPGSLPVVVVWVGAEFAGGGPREADLVVGEADLVALLDHIARAPLAACSLAVLMRAMADVSVDAGLAMESAVYSTLQAGPEFESWRRTSPAGAASPAEAVGDDRPTVLIDRVDDDVVITLDRPDRHNAISTRLRDDLVATLAVPLADPSVRSIVLRGNGPSFCSGGDLAEFGTRHDPASAHITRLARSPARMIHRLRDRIIADVHGATMGGGIEMAAFAGTVRARADTRIALPEIGLGLIPGAGGTVSLSRRIGRQRTTALALSGRSIDAATALRWGLIDEIADPAPTAIATYGGRP